MKKTLLLILFCAIYFPSHAQKYFEKLFNDNICAGIGEFIEVNDSLIRLFCNEQPYQGIGTVLIDINSKGEVINRIRLPESQGGYGKVFKLKDGNYLTAGGEVMRTMQDSTDGIISKITPYGQVIWQKNFSFFRNNGFYDLVALNDSNYYFLGSIAYDTVINNNYSDLVLMKVNAHGEEQWHKIINVTDNDDSGRLTFGNNELIISNSNIFANPYLCRVDLNGNLIWKKNIQDYRLNSPFDIFIIVNNSFPRGKSIRSTGTVGGFSGQYFSFLEIDSFGKLKNYRVYRDSSNLGRYDQSQNSIQLKDGNFLIAGVYDIPTNFVHTHGAFYLMKVDSLGNKIWENHFDNTSQHQVGTIKELKDGSILISGVENKEGNSFNRGYLVKVNSTGTITFITHFNLNSEQLEVFPNPAREQIRVYNPQKESLKIFDMQGVLAKEIEAGVSENVNIRELKPGEYIIKSATGQIARFVKE